MYLLNLVIKGLQNAEKAKGLQEAIMAIEGVSNVQIYPPDCVKISYNPTRVFPGRIRAAISSIGIPFSGG